MAYDCRSASQLDWRFLAGENSCVFPVLPLQEVYALEGCSAPSVERHVTNEELGD